MDEKRVRKAIAFFGRKIYELGELEEQTDGVLVHNIEYYLTAIEALEKQLLKKVKMRTEYRDLNDELICYKGFCPSAETLLTLTEIKVAIIAHRCLIGRKRIKTC